LDALIYVAGHLGMVDAAVVAALQKHGYRNLLLRTRAELDLTEQSAVRDFFREQRPQAVILAAARVGGIHANTSHPALFIRDNLLIESNVFDAAHRSGVQKLVFLGSSCIYPRLAPQPIREEYLLSGPLEPTNEWYAIAKIAGVKLAQAYRREFGFNAISLMPTNLYGPGDNFDLENARVLPALIRRFHEAKLRGDERLVAWGTGTPRREFLHVSDLAEAIVLLLERYEGESPINIGCGSDLTTRQLCEILPAVIGVVRRLEFDPSRPDGPPRKLLDVSRILARGWKPQIPLQSGIEQVYAWFRANGDSLRLR